MSRHRTMTDEGYLIVRDCSIASLGGRTYHTSELPQLKADSKGDVYIFRSSKELFSPETLASFEGKPLTLDHPSDVVLLDSDSCDKYQVGTVFNVRRGKGPQGDSIVADIQITKRAAIDAVEAGMRELSAGFTSRTKSIGDGVCYESGIRGNHVAIVPRGRCGPLCSLRDAAYRGNSMTTNTNDDQKKTDDGQPGASGGAPAAAAPETAEILKGLQEQIAAMTERLAKLEAGKTDDDPPAPNPDDKKPDDDAQKKTDAKPVTLDDIRKVIAEELKAKDTQAKADSAVISDAAVIAPELSKDTPDLAKQACIAYAKTDSGKAVIEALGGMTAVEANAASVLKQCAIHQRLLSGKNLNGRAKTDSMAPKTPSFFEQADKLWGK